MGLLSLLVSYSTYEYVATADCRQDANLYDA